MRSLCAACGSRKIVAEHFTAADTRHRLGELLKDKSETVN
jgi:hypothetical protein